MNAVNSEHPYRRIVTKFGTSLLTGGTSRLDPNMMSNLVKQLAALRQEGLDLAVVTSGAVACGRYKLGLPKKYKDIPVKQVLSSVGQSHLMYTYENLFSHYDIVIAQALLTRAVLVDRAGYLNARNTLLALLDLGVISIINENDVVAIDEIEGARFGDNDNLSAMVANLIDADLLVILSDIAGLYTADPGVHADARLIPEVKKIDEDIFALAGGSRSGLGTGGMYTKLQAAQMANACGITVVICKGSEPDVIVRLAHGEAIGTRFLPTASKTESRERWMLAGLSVKGRLVIDDGAAAALGKKHGSLLAAGIKEVEGIFERGDLVNVFDSQNHRLGSGIVNYTSQDIKKIRGQHSRKIADLLGYDYGSEVIHRNNLVVL
ncbi:MAG TPA: glutamate 5-kinase [Dehalococcoidales bacterium]|nr:glutamate 5-kinase [Dehalococcoidales bacterium]